MFHFELYRAYHFIAGRVVPLYTILIVIRTFFVKIPVNGIQWLPFRRWTQHSISLESGRHAEKRDLLWKIAPFGSSA